jgi:hypothetical protein
MVALLRGTNLCKESRQCQQRELCSKESKPTRKDARGSRSGWRSESSAHRAGSCTGRSPVDFVLQQLWKANDTLPTASADPSHLACLGPHSAEAEIDVGKVLLWRWLPDLTGLQVGRGDREALAVRPLQDVARQTVGRAPSDQRRTGAASKLTLHKLNRDPAPSAQPDASVRVRETSAGLGIHQTAGGVSCSHQ